MHRFLRVLLGLGCFAAAGLLIYSCVLRMTGDEMVAGSHVRAPATVPLQLESGVYGFWSVASTRGAWGAKSCGGSRNGHSLSAALENAQLATQARLVPIGGGGPVALESGGCMRVTASSGDRQTATEFRVENAGRYRLTIPRAAAIAERFYLSTGQRLVDQIPRAVGVVLLVLAGILITANRFRPRRRESLGATA
jgi:hypothetical protein